MVGDRETIDFIPLQASRNLYVLLTLYVSFYWTRLVTANQGVKQSPSFERSGMQTIFILSDYTTFLTGVVCRCGEILYQTNYHEKCNITIYFFINIT